MLSWKGGSPSPGCLPAPMVVLHFSGWKPGSRETGLEVERPNPEGRKRSRGSEDLPRMLQWSGTVGPAQVSRDITNATTWVLGGRQQG
jgi:hypothetical protein